MASGPITSWQIGGETMETVTDFILRGSKTTADGDCSHEIKRHLLLGRKAMTKLDRILKSRDVSLPTMVAIVKSMVFPVVTYGCKSWVIKRAESQRIYAFDQRRKRNKRNPDWKRISKTLTVCRQHDLLHREP